MKFFIYLTLTLTLTLTLAYTCQAQDPGNLVHQPKVQPSATVTISVTKYVTLQKQVKTLKRKLDVQRVIIKRVELFLSELLLATNVEDCHQAIRRFLGEEK